MNTLPPDVARIVERLRERYRPDRVVLFGSYARGTADRHSDLDVLIVKRTDKRPIDRRVEVHELVWDLDLHVPFSPVVYTPEEVTARLARGDAFLREILDEGVPLLG